MEQKSGSNIHMADSHDDTRREGMELPMGVPIVVGAVAAEVTPTALPSAATHWMQFLNPPSSEVERTTVISLCSSDQ